MKQVVVLFLIFVASAMPSFAIDSEFQAFWLKFKQAVKKNDKAAIASMTKLPYSFDDKKLDRDQFMKQSDKIFTPKTRSCFSTTKPIFDKTYYGVFCGDDIFIFVKEKGKYIFTEVGVND